MVKDFLWGTFNYRNKGIPLWKWPRVGYYFAKERRNKNKWLLDIGDTVKVVNGSEESIECIIIEIININGLITYTLKEVRRVNIDTGNSR